MNWNSLAPLVSIIIPCYNAERWIREAIDSCLQQTYSFIEVIVIDDGSTDSSRTILESYGSRIKLETGPNRGGNYARNLGFALSQGEYIQFLDADDYLLPEKIERQVQFLEVTGVDVVYGDWRYQYHHPDGSTSLGNVTLSGTQRDVLEALIRGWWVANHALLWRRQAVVDSDGWDEILQAGQDRDFFISVAINGADIRYQPGCFSVYRKYGKTTVSSSNLHRFIQNHYQILLKTENRLAYAEQLSEEYLRAFAAAYFFTAQYFYRLGDRNCSKQILAKVFSLDPLFKPKSRWIYGGVYRIFGFEIAEQWFGFIRAMVQHITSPILPFIKAIIGPDCTSRYAYLLMRILQS